MLKNLLFIFILLPATPLYAQTICPVAPAQKQILQKGSNFTLEEWTLKNTSTLLRRGLQPAENSLVKDFRRRISAILNPDQDALLQRKIDLVKTKFPSFSVQRETDLLARRVGRILTPSCLELQLLEAQLSTQPGIIYPENEFVAMLLSQDSQPGELKLIVSFGQLSGAGAGTNESEVRLHELIKDGWKLRFNLHNHPFLPNNSSGDVGGTLVASGDRGGGDVFYFNRLVREADMSYALITNGFHTAVFTADEIQNQLINWP